MPCRSVVAVAQELAAEVEMQVNGILGVTNTACGGGTPVEPAACSAIPCIDDCPADINDDNTINVSDLLAVISAWGACANPPCAEDVNGDDLINVSDLLAVISGWGPCP